MAEGRIVCLCADCATADVLPCLKPRETIPRTTSDSTAPPIAAELRRRVRPPLSLATGALTVAAVVAIAVALGGNRQPPLVLSSWRIPAQVHQRKVTLEEPSWALLDLRPERREDQWVHPVAAAFERVPSVDGRKFGAERPGNRPSECRRGHCGVDLGGPRGTPVVAVLPGVVGRIETSGDRRSGRYVRIDHDDGTQTSYMHLDRISPYLEKGQRVLAGHMLGTLGRTGINHSDPHLHFGLAVPTDSKHLRFIDPSPFLEDSVVIDIIDIELPGASPATVGGKEISPAIDKLVELLTPAREDPDTADEQTAD